MHTRIERALITGASAGLGAEFARQLADRGVAQVLVARRSSRLEELAARLPVEVEVLVADLTDPDDRAVVEARVASMEDPVDLLVNNAGFGAYGPFSDQDVRRQSEMLDLNVTALTRLTRAAIGQLLARGTGGVVNVASTAAFQPDPYGAVYGGTKAYVRSFTEALYEELRGTGVHAMVLAPGFTETEFQAVASVARSALPQAAKMSAEPVVRAALRDFAQGRAVCVPGMVNRVSAAAADVTPSVLARKVSKLVHDRFSA